MALIIRSFLLGRGKDGRSVNARSCASALPALALGLEAPPLAGFGLYLLAAGVAFASVLPALVLGWLSISWWPAFPFAFAIAITTAP